MNLELLQLSSTVENFILVQNVLEEAPGYSFIISGQLPTENEGQEVFQEIPPNFSLENKVVLGIFIKDEMIGVVDYLIGYPNNETVYLGLLLLKESFQQKNYGKVSYEKLEENFRQIEKITKIRLSVIETNQKGITFWKKMGFHLTGEKKAYENKKMFTNVLLMEKDIA